jgi:peptidoglycan/LPS O-acetylase OafA/YrhL
MNNQQHAYIQAIDGLRALAVLSVLTFHLTPHYLPGGFVGVDIFFAISGYVVCTTALAKPSDSFWQFCSAFYARRVRRIMPALLVVLLVTSLLSALFVPEAWLSQANKRTGFAAYFGMSNFVLGSFAGDYFSPRAEYNPFTHTWSLAIEEQFYLLFAPLMFLACMSRKPLARAWGGGLLLILTVVSLGLCVLLSQHSPVWAFYGSPARFWEMLVGVLTCLALPKLAPLLIQWPRQVAHALGWGLLGSLIAAIWLADSRQFPWPWAAWPVLATAALMALVTVREDLSVSRWLASGPARWLGQRSYSLYLWHWPVYVLMRWTCGLDTPLQHVLAVVVSVALATVSYRWVEQPFRHGGWGSRWPDSRQVVAGGVLTMCVAGMSAVMFKLQSHVSLSVTHDKHEWFPDSAPVLDSSKISCSLKQGKSSLQAGQIEFLEPFNCKNSVHARTVFVLGDSHAGAYFAMLAEFVQTSGYRVQILRMDSCPVFNLREPNASHHPRCAAFADAALMHVQARAKPGDVLFLPSLRLRRLIDQWTIPQRGLPELLAQVNQGDSIEEAIIEAQAALKPLADMGVRVIMEAPKPISAAPAFRCSDWFNENNPVCRLGQSIPRQEIELYRAKALDAVSRVVAQTPGAMLWDPLPLLCSDRDCGAFKEGHPVIFDGDHLTGYANKILLPSFTLSVSMAMGPE